MAWRKKEQTIFFPWERGKSLWGVLGEPRSKSFVLVVVGLAVFLLFGLRERKIAGIRSTRATLLSVHAAMEDYRADHELQCPPSLAVLKAEGYLATEPIDAWGRSIRLICPSRTVSSPYDLLSDGPDGEIGGLDRVE